MRKEILFKLLKGSLIQLCIFIIVGVLLYVYRIKVLAFLIWLVLKYN
jgi:hypothetical protein